MIHEIAEIEIETGREGDFESAVAQTLETLRGAQGCHRVRILRGIEHASRYRLVLDWETVEHHEAFRGTPQFAEWGLLVSRFFAAPPQVEHFEDITAGS